MNENSDLIGQLFISTSKDGKTVYLRGHVRGQRVVCFLSKKDGQSYHVLADNRPEIKQQEGQPQRQEASNNTYKRTYRKVSAPF